MRWHASCLFSCDMPIDAFPSDAGAVDLDAFRRMLHEIGRGARGARALPPADARLLWDALLDRRLPPEMTGAILMAYRFKGETADEIGALVDSALARSGALDDLPTRLVVLPCYNGARRLPNLSWLVALALRDAGFAVLMHGVRRQAGRLTTCEVAEAAGVQPAACARDAVLRLQRDRIAFLPIDVWCPPLAGLLSMRDLLGVRNSAHTAVKLLTPPRTALALVPVTHADYLPIASEVLEQRGVTALLFRGVDGEPALHPNTRRDLLRLIDRRVEPIEFLPAQAPDPALDLPAGASAARVVEWSAEIIAGRRPMPSMLGQLVALCVETIEGCRVSALVGAGRSNTHSGEQR